MRKIMTILILFIFLSTYLNVSANKISIKDDDIIEMINQVSKSTIENYLSYLVENFPSRTLGSRNIENAEKFIIKEMQKNSKLDIYTQDWENFGDIYFGHGGHYKGRNIIAEYKSPTSDESIVVFTVHHDCGKDSPGADDDGSGVSALLMIADIITKYNFNHTILLCSASGEEVGLLGDFHLAKWLYENKKDVIAAITADAIGYNPNDCEDKVNLYYPERSKWISNLVINVHDKYSNLIGLSRAVATDFYAGNSGHRAYEDYGYNCLKFFEGKANPGWEQPPRNEDYLENINFSYLTKITKLIISTLATLADNSLEEPKLEIVYPKEDLEYKDKKVISENKIKKGRTNIIGDIEIIVNVSEDIEKVTFELFPGDNEKNNGESRWLFLPIEDRNDEWPRPVIENITLTESPYKLTIKDNYSGWYTLRATAYDRDGNHYIDEIELMYSNFIDNILVFMEFLGLFSFS